MNLFINSPAYFTREHGVIDEIYKMCSLISRKIDITLYTDPIDTIGIVPIIAPAHVVESGQIKEEKYISLSYRMASISLFTDYEVFCSAEMEQKKQMIIENILRSLNAVKRRLKGRFDCEQMKKDILELLERNQQE